MFEKSGRIRLFESEGFGGKSFDSVHLSRFFKSDKPHDFGVQVARMFSSSNKYSYKPLTKLTIGEGNVFEINGDIYRWTLIVDDYRRVEIREFLETGNTRIGWNGEQFKIGLAEGWYGQPDVLSLDDNRYPIEVIGQPIQRGNYFEYTVRLQSGNPNEFLDASLLQPGRTVCRVSSTVGIEMNQDHNGVSMGTQIDLQSHLGAFAKEFEITDRIIREELNAKRDGTATFNGTPYTSGYMFPLFDKNTGKAVQKGGFMTYMEAKLMDELEEEREWSMTYGKSSVRVDSTGRYIKRTAPGFRELAKDGHEFYYNTSIDAQTLEDYFMAVLLGRTNESDRKVVIDTGTLGARIFDQLLSDEAGAFLTQVDTGNDYFVRNKGAAGDLEYGFQYKSFRAKNGLEISLSMNPMKDSKKYCNRLYPFNPIYPIDSARMDIYDFSENGASEAPSRSNIAMAKVRGLDSYYWFGGCVDPKSGIINDGSQATSGEKGVVYRRETSGGLIIWDTSKIGSIIYEPTI